MLADMRDPAWVIATPPPGRGRPEVPAVAEPGIVHANIHGPSHAYAILIGFRSSSSGPQPIGAADILPPRPPRRAALARSRPVTPVGPGRGGRFPWGAPTAVSTLPATASPPAAAPSKPPVCTDMSIPSDACACQSSSAEPPFGQETLVGREAVLRWPLTCASWNSAAHSRRHRHMTGSSSGPNGTPPYLRRHARHLDFMITLIGALQRACRFAQRQSFCLGRWARPRPESVAGDEFRWR